MPYRPVGLVVLVTLGMLMAPRGSAAQPPKQVAQVGILFPSLSRDAPFLQAFEQCLQALGYREGHNLAIEFRTAEGQSEGLPALAAELTQLPVDVLVAAEDRLTGINEAADSQGLTSIRPGRDAVPRASPCSGSPVAPVVTGWCAHIPAGHRRTRPPLSRSGARTRPAPDAWRRPAAPWSRGSWSRRPWP